LADLATTLVHRALFPTFDAGPTTAAAGLDPANARERARREGLEVGRHQGRAEALAAATPRFEAACSALEKAAGALGERRDALAAEMEVALPPIVLGLAERILGRELLAEDAGAAAVRAVVARLARPTGHVSVRVGAAAAEALQALRRAGGGPGGSVSIEHDPALGAADWMLETGEGRIDGRLATQLAEAGRLLEAPEA
jgi:flagellar biosynthesis/type III secretory pathway protein FliH